MKIGIYFKDYNWAKGYFNYLLKMEDIVYTKESKYRFFIQCVNKDTIDFILAKDCAKGYKFDKIYLQDGVDLNTYRLIIAPTLMHRYQIDDPIQIVKEQNNNYSFISINEYLMEKNFYGTNDKNL